MRGCSFRTLRWIGLAVLLVAVVFAAVAWRVARHRPAASLPTLDLAGVSANVVRLVEESLENVQQAPDSAKDWGHLGMVLMAHHWDREALGCFERALALDPREIHWRYYTAVLQERTDLPAAVKNYELASTMDPAHAPLWYRWGITLLRLNRIDEAEQRLQRAKELAPSAVEPHIGLGRVANSRGDLDAARAHFERAMSIDPNNREARVELARVYYRQGDQEMASVGERLSTQPSMANSKMPDPLLNEIDALEAASQNSAKRADQLLVAGDLTAAERLLRQLVQERPDLSRPQFNLATVLLRRKDFQGAVAVLRPVVQEFPDDALGHYVLGSALEASGDLPGALVEYRESVRLKSDYAQAHFAMGLLLERQGDPSAAVRSYRLAVESDPRFAPAQLALGVALERAGDLAGAERHIQNAVALVPGDPLPQDHLQRVRQARTRDEKAGKRNDAQTSHP